MCNYCLVHVLAQAEIEMLLAVAVPQGRHPAELLEEVFVCSLPRFRDKRQAAAATAKLAQVRPHQEPEYVVLLLCQAVLSLTKDALVISR